LAKARPFSTSRTHRCGKGAEKQPIFSTFYEHQPWISGAKLNQDLWKIRSNLWRNGKKINPKIPKNRCKLWITKGKLWINAGICGKFVLIMKIPRLELGTWRLTASIIT
jgi:hypothetical protein